METKALTNQSEKISGICLVFPVFAAKAGESASIRLADFVRLVEPSVEHIFVITIKDESRDLFYSGKVHFLGDVVCPKAGAPILPTIFGELKAQIQIARALTALPDYANLIFCRGRSSTLILPLLLARLRGKKSILFVESRGSELVGKVYQGPLSLGDSILSPIYKVVEGTSYSLAHRLVADFPSLLQQPWLNKRRDKVFPVATPIRFVNPEFKVSKRLDHRETIVGYIGRMSQEKGVLDLVKAIPPICEQMKGVKFVLGGDGPLLEQVRRELTPLIRENQANVPGWIPHEQVPDYLNRMKLLVLPSDYEGLGVIVLEAMACGTPVVAMPVGAVPDVIRDGETGFIMEDNSPECIARNVVRALNHPNLDQISHNASALVEKEYYYEAMKEKWSKLLTMLSIE